MNSNKSAILYSIVTNYIPFESSKSQLSDHVFHMQLRLGDNLRGQNDFHITATFHSFIAGMTSIAYQ